MTNTMIKTENMKQADKFLSVVFTVFEIYADYIMITCVFLFADKTTLICWIITSEDV